MHRLIFFGVFGLFLAAQSTDAQVLRRHGHHRAAHVHIIHNVVPVQNLIPSHRFVPYSTARVIQPQPRYRAYPNRQIIVQSPVLVQAVPQFTPLPYFDPAMVQPVYQNPYQPAYVNPYPSAYPPQGSYYPPSGVPYGQPIYGQPVTGAPIPTGVPVGSWNGAIPVETNTLGQSTLINPAQPTPAQSELPEPIEGVEPINNGGTQATPKPPVSEEKPTTTLDIKTPPLEPVEEPQTNSILNVDKTTKSEDK